MSTHHKTRPVLVWADVDEGIADFVLHLNTLAGIRTYTSCQGTLGEGGVNPYRAQVMVSWADDAALALLACYDMTPIGKNHAYVHPKQDEVT